MVLHLPRATWLTHLSVAVYMRWLVHFMLLSLCRGFDCLYLFFFAWLEFSCLTVLHLSCIVVLFDSIAVVMHFCDGLRVLGCLGDSSRPLAFRACRKVARGGSKLGVFFEGTKRGRE